MQIDENDVRESRKWREPMQSREEASWSAVYMMAEAAGSLFAMTVDND